MFYRYGPLASWSPQWNFIEEHNRYEWPARRRNCLLLLPTEKFSCYCKVFHLQKKLHEGVTGIFLSGFFNVVCLAQGV